MKQCLVWEKTGDSLRLDILDESLFEHYVEQLRDSNQFRVIKSPDVDETIPRLVQNLKIVNEGFQKFFKKEFFNSDQDFRDQSVLNALHFAWVMEQKKFTGLRGLLQQINVDLCNAFLVLNMELHHIESSWEWEIEGLPFIQPILNLDPGGDRGIWSRANLNIDYGTLGRGPWEKFATWGTIDEEYSLVEHLSPKLHVNFNRPYSFWPPFEIAQWCKRNNVPCSQNHIPLANFHDLEKNHSVYRILFHRNALLQDNYLVIK